MVTVYKSNIDYIIEVTRPDCKEYWEFNNYPLSCNGVNIYMGDDKHGPVNPNGRKLKGIPKHLVKAILTKI